MRTFKLGWILFAFGFCMLLSAPKAMAQVTTGSISGTTVDQSGAAIPGVAVTATNSGTGAVSKTTSDSSGLFRFSLLPVGDYNLEFTKQGFASTKVAAISVSSGLDRGLGTVKLQVGSTSTTVEVTGAAPLVESTQAQISTSISSQQLTTFPGISEAEGLDNLAITLPGVSMARDDSFSNSNGPDFSVNGIRSRNNDQQIDGENNNDNSVAGPSIFVVNPDFVQEYDITTNNFSAEYGRNSGSAVNEVTKSGTNVWHGDVMGNETNSYLDALDNFQKAPQSEGGEGLTKLPRRNEEFSGGTIGGPVWKNHVFVFGGFDTDLVSQFSVATNGLTPTPSGLAELAACYPGSASVQALQKFGAFGVGAGNPQPFFVETDQLAGAPVPNGTGGVCNVDLGDITRSIGVPFHQFDWIYRTDAVISDQDKLTGRYIFQKQHSFGNSAGGYPDDVPALSQSFLLTETHTFSSRMVNEWRGSFSRSNVEFGGNSLGNTIPPASQLTSALASVGISGLLGFGPANNLPQSRIVNTYQLQDNWNFYQGKSQWKAGVNFTYQRSPNIFLPNINGTYSFSTFTNSGAAFTSAGGCNVAAGEKLAVAGQPTRAGALSAFACDIPNTISVAQGNPSLDFREYDTFLYAGNDYKVKDNLTLNLGLTWSYYGQPANLFNKLTTEQQTGSTPFWDPSLPLSITTAPKIPAIHDLFGPGVGFAYSPKWGGWLTGGAQQRTVLRGGYRYSYDPPFYNIYLNIASSSPQVVSQTLSNFAAGASASSFALNNPLPAVPSGPNVRAQLASSLQFGVFDPRNFNQTRITPNFGPDRVQDWSFGIQREFSSHLVAEARYVGNHGTDLFQSIDQNPLIANLAAAFPNVIPSGDTPCSAANAQITSAIGRVNCDEGVIRQRTNTAYSDYNGVQTEIRATNLFNQLTLRANYTWSKTTDNASEIFSTNGGGNTVAISQDPLSFGSAEHGLSGLNYPQTFAVTAYEMLPFFKSEHGVIGHVLGGFEVSATYLLQSGQGYTPVQFCLSACSGEGPNLWDTPFDAAFFGIDETARPYVGSLSAPATSAGIFGADACALVGACNYTDTGAAIPANQLLDWGVVATTGAAATSNNVTNKQVRYIVNAPEANAVFGTPFGNVERNLARDYQTNSANISLYKNIKFNERATLQFHASLLNAFNHPNFGSVDPFIDDAGVPATADFNVGTFGNPLLTEASSRTVWFGLKVIF